MYGCYREPVVDNFVETLARICLLKLARSDSIIAS